MGYVVYLIVVETVRNALYEYLKFDYVKNQSRRQDDSVTLILDSLVVKVLKPLLFKVIV